MEVQELELPGVKKITPKRFTDERGFFQETWNSLTFRKNVCAVDFVQDNHSCSAQAGTIRGLHFQREPFAQGKLIRVIHGSIFDVVVDVRPDYNTFGKHLTMTLDAISGVQLWVPIGFLHGFCTLEPDTEVLYKVTNYYSREHDGGVVWNDPDLKISWPVKPQNAVLSEKDKHLPRWRDLSLKLAPLWYRSGF